MFFNNLGPGTFYPPPPNTFVIHSFFPPFLFEEKKFFFLLVQEFTPQGIIKKIFPRMNIMICLRWDPCLLFWKRCLNATVWLDSSRVIPKFSVKPSESTPSDCSRSCRLICCFIAKNNYLPSFKIILKLLLGTCTKASRLKLVNNIAEKNYKIFRYPIVSFSILYQSTVISLRSHAEIDQLGPVYYSD